MSAEAIARAVETAPEHAPRWRFPLMAFGDINVNAERSYLVKGLLPRVGLAVMWGPPKCGKSFLAFDMAAHVALGREYRGRRVVAGPVVYVACEGAEGLRARVEAFRIARLADDHEPPPLYVIPSNLDLIVEHGQLIADIGGQIGETAPVAVVLDTLNRSLRGSENSDEDMGNYVKAADAVREAFACAVIVVHHCGIEGTRPRGHTSLTGAADTQLAVAKADGGTITARVEFQKDGPEGDEWHSRLAVVEVGTDPDGDAVTSCVVEEADAPATGRTRITGQARTAHELLVRAVTNAGEIPPPSPHIPGHLRAVRSDMWKDYCRHSQICASDKPDTFDKAFKRAAEKLQERGIIGVWGEWVWLADKSDNTGQ